MTDAMFDDDLQSVLGESRCIDATKPEPPKKAPAKKQESHVVYKKTNYMQRLRACVKTTLPIAIASVVVFWWQISGQLNEEAANPALWILAILFGISVGRVAK